MPFARSVLGSVLLATVFWWLSTSAVHAQQRTPGDQNDRREKKESDTALDKLVGNWQLEKIEFATPKGYKRTEIDNSKETVCAITITKKTIRSVTKNVAPFSKENERSELFNDTATIKTGDDPAEQLVVHYKGIENGKEAEFSVHYLYALDGDSLALVFDTKTLDKHPDSVDLRKGKEVGRVALFLQRTKAK